MKSLATFGTVERVPGGKPTCSSLPSHAPFSRAWSLTLAELLAFTICQFSFFLVPANPNDTEKIKKNPKKMFDEFKSSYPPDHLSLASRAAAIMEHHLKSITQLILENH